jgi:hypothetical protein
MHVNTSEILDEWKSAEASAREAERRLAAAWEHFERTRTDPPTPELFEEVTLRRRLASERLSQTMRALWPNVSQ